MPLIHTRQQAREAIAAGDLDEALDYWTALCSADAAPEDFLEYLELLWALYRLADAVLVQEKLLHHPATTSQQCLAVAKRLFDLHRYPESARFTFRAFVLDPTNPDIAAMHAASLERSGEFQKAREVLCSTLENFPNHARSVRHLSHMDRIQGDHDLAIQRLTRQLAHQSSADDWRLRYELAAALDNAGDPVGAMRELLAAKQQLAPVSLAHYKSWRELSDRQWLLTTSLDAHRLRSWQDLAGKLQPSMRICLMAGFPRSGTTLLERILVAHPECIGTDESGILATQFRNPLVFEAPDIVTALAELDALDAESLADGREEYLRCTCEYLGEQLDGRILIEKEPLLTADLAVPLRLFPEAKILIPLRDPRDVVISFFFTIVPLSPNSVAATDLGECCRYYAEVMRHWLHLREILPSAQWMESRYEDLLEDPELQTKKLATFLGVTWQSDMLSNRANTQGRGVSTPTYADVAKPLYSHSMKRWKHYRKWLEPHLHHLQPFIEAFGYEDSIG